MGKKIRETREIDGSRFNYENRTSAETGDADVGRIFEKHGGAASCAVTLFTLFIKHFRHLHK